MLTGEQPGHGTPVPPAAESPVAGRRAVGGAGLGPAQVLAHPAVLHRHENSLWPAPLEHAGPLRGLGQSVSAGQAEGKPASDAVC